MSQTSIAANSSAKNLVQNNTKIAEKVIAGQKVSIFGKYELIFAYSFVTIWILFLLDFVFWFFFNSYSTNNFFFFITSLNIFWLPALALYFYFFSLRQVDFAKDFDKIPDGKVALITTKIPSEPFDIVKNTLEHMLAQEKVENFDVWLCDEDPSDETMKWCKKYGVSISTRKGDPDYQRTEHPRKRKCKEGNLAYFYDHYGYDNYDFAIQFDADHAPESDFAFEVMKHFNDETVGYVASPSIIDSNMDESWTVKARNFWESTTHGPLQSGSQNGFAPVCFGSHYSLRIKALKEVGGIGPEIAEDYTTTLMMNSKGWKGSFARDAIAHGMGAVGIADCMQQEYQWALVGMRAGLLVAPKVFVKVPLKIKLQMLVWTFWYPAVTIIALISIIVPIICLWFNFSPLFVNNNDFWIKYAILNAGFIMYVVWLKNLNHLRPQWSWQVSWETLVFQMLQLPWILIGWTEGLYQVVTRFNPHKSSKIKFTDKANFSSKPINFRWFAPHFIVIIFSIAPVIYFSPARPYYWFALFTALVYSVAVFAGVILSIKEVSIFEKYKNAKVNYIKKFFGTISVSTLLLVISILSLLKSFIY